MIPSHVTVAATVTVPASNDMQPIWWMSALADLTLSKAWRYGANIVASHANRRVYQKLVNE